MTRPAPNWPPSSPRTCAAWTPGCAAPARNPPPRSGPPAPPSPRCSGVGPVIAGTIIGAIAGVLRFPGRDHFAASNGTAPVEVSSGNRKTRRLSLRGNRRINHAIHMAAITQIRQKHSDGRAYYDKKAAEGKTRKQALRSLKRQISNAIYACLLAGAGQPASSQRKWPGRATGQRRFSAALHPERRIFGQATPGPGHHDTARHQGSHTLAAEADFKENPGNHLTAAAKRTLLCADVTGGGSQRWPLGSGRSVRRHMG